MEAFEKESSKYTEEGMEVYNELDRALKPIFKAWMDKGMSPREIGCLAVHTAIDIECEQVLTKAYKSRKKDEPNTG